MRAQISLELLIYVALAGLSLASTLPWAARLIGHVATEESTYGISQFVNALNTKLIDGSNEFSAFVPKGLCGANMSGAQLVTNSGVFYLIEPLAVRGKLCPDGTYASFLITENETGLTMRRLQ